MRPTSVTAERVWAHSFAGEIILCSLEQGHSYRTYKILEGYLESTLQYYGATQ